MKVDFFTGYRADALRTESWDFMALNAKDVAEAYEMGLFRTDDYKIVQIGSRKFRVALEGDGNYSVLCCAD